jgi:hypothetical protein
MSDTKYKNAAQSLKELKRIVAEMQAIVNDPQADHDERAAAKDTVDEANCLILKRLKEFGRLDSRTRPLPRKRGRR